MTHDRVWFDYDWYSGLWELSVSWFVSNDGYAYAWHWYGLSLEDRPDVAP